MYNNYCQALEVLKDGEVKLRILESNLGTTSADYENYLQEERLYLASLQKEPDELVKTVSYMEKLEKLRDAT